jgi:hypothetical protein
MSIEERILADKNRLIEQLRKTPIVQIACEKTGIGRATFYRWCQDEEFASKARDSLQEGKSLVNDLAESQLISSIKDKRFQAISFWLKHNHPDYRTKVELSSMNNQENLSEEQQEKIMLALELLQGNRNADTNE